MKRFLPILIVALAACEHTSATRTVEAPAGAPDVVSDGVYVEADKMFAQYNKNLPKPGDDLPDLAGATLDGTRVDNAAIAGKTVLLNLWFFH